MARQPGDRPGEAIKSKFLCGHDERSWFVAAIPEAAHARDVQSARNALKPAEVWQAIERAGLRTKERDLRRTDAFVRQGEWFFLPRPKLQVDEFLILRNEPIRRGGGKPHLCQYLYRTAGEAVYVCRAYPNGLTESEYRAIPITERRRHSWSPMRRNAQVFVKGTVRHPDHKTIHLSGWHLVVMNTETRARAMAQVAFLD
jgi:hypothetical protein